LQAVNHFRGKNLCFVAKGRGFEEREVVVGLSNASWVAIESGLREGETVLLSPPIEYIEAEKDSEQNGSAPPDLELDAPEGADSIPTSPGEPANESPANGERGLRPEGGRPSGKPAGRPSGQAGTKPPGAGSAGVAQ
jgi:hypothetical protein